MDLPDKNDVLLRTFNTAKKFADEILFLLMTDFKKFQRISNFGSSNLDDAMMLSEEIREIQRFNGLKGMLETAYDLLLAISSTVLSKKNILECSKLSEMIERSKDIRELFYDERDKFFTTTYKDSKTIEVIDRKYFWKIREIIDVIYVNTEVLMTKNKLLFADSNDEFKSDVELMEQIKKDFMGE